MSGLAGGSVDVTARTSGPDPERDVKVVRTPGRSATERFSAGAELKYWDGKDGKGGFSVGVTVHLEGAPADDMSIEDSVRRSAVGHWRALYEAARKVYEEEMNG